MDPRELRTLWGAAYEPVPAPAVAVSVEPSRSTLDQGPDLAARTQRAAARRVDHPVGPVGDDGHGPLSRRGARSRQPVLSRQRRDRSVVTESLALAQAVHDLVEADKDAAAQAGDHRRRRPAQPGLRPQRGDGRPPPGDGRRRPTPTTARASPDTPSSPSSSAPPFPADSSPTVCRPTRSWRSTTRASRSMPCTRRPPPASRCGPSTQLDELAKTVVPMSYNVEDWAKLGFCDGLLKVDQRRRPNPARRRGGRRRDRRRRPTGPQRTR